MSERKQRGDLEGMSTGGQGVKKKKKAKKNNTNKVIPEK